MIIIIQEKQGCAWYCILVPHKLDQTVWWKGNASFLVFLHSLCLTLTAWHCLPIMFNNNIGCSYKWWLFCCPLRWNPWFCVICEHIFSVYLYLAPGAVTRPEQWLVDLQLAPPPWMSHDWCSPILSLLDFHWLCAWPIVFSVMVVACVHVSVCVNIKPNVGLTQCAYYIQSIHIYIYIYIYLPIIYEFIILNVTFSKLLSRLPPTCIVACDYSPEVVFGVVFRYDVILLVFGDETLWTQSFLCVKITKRNV